MMPQRLLLSFLPLGLLAFLASAMPVLAQTPQQEKRIALVVGNGNYAKGPLATLFPLKHPYDHPVIILCAV